MSKTEKAPKKKRANRVLRGGSRGNGPQYARSASRILDAPGRRYTNVGVRLVEVIDEQE